MGGTRGLASCPRGFQARPAEPLAEDVFREVIDGLFALRAILSTSSIVDS